MPPKSRKQADLLSSSDPASPSQHELAGPYRGAAPPLTVKGTNGADQFDGTYRDEYVYGLGGNDVLWGLSGSDRLYGGNGDDKLFGGTGNNKLYGGAGNDYLGGWKFDYLSGGSGNDLFDVWAENIAEGGAGNDRFRISNDRPTIMGGAGRDSVEFNLLSKNFKASYADGNLLLRTDYSGFYKPQFELTDESSIEKIVWKDFTLTPKLKSTPTITGVYASTEIEEGGTTSAPLSAVVGQTDPFARVRVMADGVLIGTTVADINGHWNLRHINVDFPEGPISLTATADYGTGTKARTTADSFDIIIGLPGGEVPGDYVYSLDSDEVTFITLGTDYGAYFGSGTSALGDVNGDGIDDWLIIVEDDSERLWGAGAYVVYGQDGTLGQIVDGRSVLDLSAMTADDGFLIEVGAINAFFAQMTTAGDFNGDGTDDMMFNTVEDGVSSVKVFYSGIGQFGELDGQDRLTASIDDLTEDQLLTIVLRDGVTDSDASLGGQRMGSVGDVNGDGFDDIVICVADGLGADAYLIYGGASLGTSVGGKRVLDVANLDADQGVHLSGYGLPLVESAGDVNGDGFDDFIVGSRVNNIAAMALVFGSAAGIGEIDGSSAELDLRNLAPDQGLLIKDNINNFWTNAKVEQLGDFNGDGHDDLLFQSHDRLTVVFGSGSGIGELVDGKRQIVLEELSADEGFTINMNVENWQRPPDISRIGDFNGDGFDDFAINRLRTGLDNHDKAFVIFGTNEAMAPATDGEITLTIQDLKRSQTRAFILDGEHVAAAGDLNGDGYDDLISETGHFGYAPTIIYGQPTSFATSVTRTGTSDADILIGKAGDDILDGNGGADTFRGGRGNDTIRIGDATFERINAGRGTNDTVEFDGAGITLDARDFGNAQLRGIEAFNLTGTGDNTLILTAFDVFHLSPNRNGAFTASESSNSLVVRGDDGDTLELIAHSSANWTLSDADVGLDGSSGGDFDIYQLRDGARVLASIAVSESVTLVH